jgi:hypothetical protein
MLARGARAREHYYMQSANYQAVGENSQTVGENSQAVGEKSHRVGEKSHLSKFLREKIAFSKIVVRHP